MKKVLFMLLFICMIVMSASSIFAGEARDDFYIEHNGKSYQYKGKVVSVNIDGRDISMGEMPGIIVEDRTLVPAREVFESDSFQAEVEWNGKKEEVYISYKNINILLKIGSDTAYVNDKAVALDVPANLIRDLSQKNHKTMIPLRFVTESLGYDVEWVHDTYTAKITTGSQNENEEEPIKEEPIEEEPIEEEPIGEGDKLDELDSDKAKKDLPTLLKKNPIIWSKELVDQDDFDFSEIPTQKNKEVKISSIQYLSDGGEERIVIKASGPLTEVEKTSWDDKFIIDIKNAELAITSSKLNLENNSLIKDYRTDQKAPDSDGQKNLRLVFDLKYPSTKYDAVISSDRSTLTLKRETLNLGTIELGQNDQGDYLKLVGSIAPEANIFRLSNPDRIIFDLTNMTSLIGYEKESNTQGQYISAIRTAPYEEGMTRIVLETDGQPDYTIRKLDDKTTLVQFVEPSYSNIKYENVKLPTITLQNIAPQINLEGITYEDQYYNNKYIIHLPGNYEDVFGKGIIRVDDKIIDMITIEKNKDGNTDLIIDEKGIYVFRLEKDEKNVYIKVYRPREIYSQILLMDFGHGGTDPGATRNGYREKDLNLAIGSYLKEYLDGDSSFKVYYSRTDDTFISLQGRTDLANSVEADFFISIHNNSADSSSVNGTETFYFKDNDRPGLNSIELAQILHKKVVEAVGLKDRGIKEGNGLFVLRNTKMPAALVEVGFVPNATDIKKISDPAVQKKVAKAIYDSIAQVFKEYPTGR